MTSNPGHPLHGALNNYPVHNQHQFVNIDANFSKPKLFVHINQIKEYLCALIFTDIIFK